MKFRDLFQDVEDWFWKLEFNPELSSYELYLGIPNDWLYSDKESDITIELIHEMENNSMIKIYATKEEFGIDDILDTAKNLILKNKELEIRKETHKEEMENLKNLLIEKEKNFLNYIDTIKDSKVSDEEEEEESTEETSEEVTNKDEDVSLPSLPKNQKPKKYQFAKPSATKDDFMKDIKNS